jgi:hypothetical protein
MINDKPHAQPDDESCLITLDKTTRFAGNNVKPIDRPGIYGLVLVDENLYFN